MIVSQIPLQEKPKEIREYAISRHVPVFIADPTEPAARDEFQSWIKNNGIAVLFITGPAQSRDTISQKEIFSFIHCLIGGVLKNFDLGEMDIEEFCRLQHAHDKAFVWLTPRLKEVMRILTKNPEKTMAVFQNNALSGNPIDLFYLGTFYLGGEIVRRDMEKAASYFMQAACCGHVKSMRLLAECYRSGNGIQQDLAAACNWLWHAAEFRDTVAQCNLGAFYAEHKDAPPQVLSLKLTRHSMPIVAPIFAISAAFRNSSAPAIES